MDPTAFDALARSFHAARSRRRLLSLLAALPLLGGLLIQVAEEAEGKDRRDQRERPHEEAHQQRVGDAGKKKGKKKRKRKCAAAGQTTSKKRKTCCSGLTKDASGRCAAPVVCSGLTPIGSSPTQGLQEAIDAAAAGSTLTLCAGTWHLTTTVRITKALTLVGAGAGQTILNGQGRVQVLETSHAPLAGLTGVQLRDLTISNGRGNTGGGILNVGLLTLAGVSITGNTANIAGGFFNSGGGIHNLGTLILGAGSVIGGTTPAEANTARFGGGIFNGVIGTVTLQDGSRVTGNIATTNGGGIDNSGTLTVAAQALVCNNTPLENPDDQCIGPGSITGNCPNPADGICPP
jgi:hypothetical protein